MVGVVAPSGAVEEARLGAGIAVLEGLGVAGGHRRSRPGSTAAIWRVRTPRAGADLQRMLDDPDVRAIFCARGGFGSQRIVPTLDLTTLRRQPKPVVGYSDATALLIALARASVVAVHGPMVAVDLARGLTARSLAHLDRVLGDPGYLWEVEVPVAIRPGRATRPTARRHALRAGDDSRDALTRRTLDGAIVFLEDVHEWPYRLDRLLTQLRQSGKLDRAAGVVFGTMEACRALDGVTAIDVIRDVFADAAYPVGLGVPAGHSSAHADVENLALPFGRAGRARRRCAGSSRRSSRRWCEPMTLPSPAPGGFDGVAEIDRRAVDARRVPRRRDPGRAARRGRSTTRPSASRSIEPERTPMARDTIFDLSSLTKPLATTIAVMLLVREGKLRPDDRVTRFFHNFGVHGKTHVTFRHLLAHCSGLPAWRPFYKDDRPRIERDGRINFVGSRGAKEYVYEQIHRERLEQPPGTRAVYSDLGFMLLGALVELVTQPPLDRFCHERIFRPLGLRADGVHRPGRAAPRQARAGHRR